MSGPNAISIADIEAYYRFAGLDEGVVSRRAFLRLMAQMDDCYLLYTSDKRKAEMEAQKRERSAQRR